MMKKPVIVASILDADFLCLKKQLEMLWKINIDTIHYDVMDYQFVNNISFGSKILSDITSKMKFNIDCHLMVKIIGDVSDFLIPYVNAKANSITLHYEALTTTQIQEFITFCQKHQIKKALAINPDTNVEVLRPYLPVLDQVLIMSVIPGKGGQKFMMPTLKKISQLKNIILQEDYQTLIQVDGGINPDTIKLCVEKGANIVVVGSYLMNHFDPLQAMKELQSEWK